MKKIYIIIVVILIGIIGGICISLNFSKKDSSTDEDLSINIDYEQDEIDWLAYESYELDLSDSTVIKNSGVYYLTGEINNGMITVNTDGPVKLILNDISVTNNSGPAIYIENADVTYIELAEDTNNTLKDDGSSEFDGVIYSKDDLIIEGNGILNITANNQDGIVSKDDLVINSGNIIINSADDGIRGKDYVVIKNGEINITSSGNAIKSTNEEDETKGSISIQGGNITIKSSLDGVQSVKDLEITGGTFNIQTGSGSSVKSTNSMWAQKNSNTESMKGLKATGNIVITNGTFELDTEDDSIHSNSSISISGGDYSISSGDDGIHADNTLIIDGGNININQSYEGLEASKVTINDGSINVTSSDDGINIAGGNDSSSMNRPGQNNISNNSNANLTINGGTIYVNSTGDGLDSNGNMYLNGGYVTVDGPTDNGNSAIDYDGEFVITNGTLIAVGSSGMAQAPSNSSTQNTVFINLTSTMSGTIKIGDIEYTPSKNYSSIIISSPLLETGNSYDLMIDNTNYTTFTQNSTITTIGNSMMSPGMNGDRGNRGAMMR